MKFDFQRSGRNRRAEGRTIVGGTQVRVRTYDVHLAEIPRQSAFGQLALGEECWEGSHIAIMEAV